MKNIKNYTEEIGNKVLLIIESPLYPVIYLFLKYKLKTEQGRKDLYLKTKGFFPLRRLFFYILDKLFEEECNHFKKPSYDGYAGYILDLKYALAHNYFNKKTFNNNYVYSVSHIQSIIAAHKHTDFSIIDYGCGAGVMTRLVEKMFPVSTVVGLDIRKETLEYNTILYPTVTWDLVSSLDKYIESASHKKTILLSNGVINFMTLQELEDLLSKKIDYIVWFYYSSYKDPKKEYSRNEIILSKKHNDIDYNIQRLLDKYRYTFKYTVVPIGEGGGNFIHGVSKRM